MDARVAVVVTDVTALRGKVVNAVVVVVIAAVIVLVVAILVVIQSVETVVQAPV
jgi:hypothetical protein